MPASNSNIPADVPAATPRPNKAGDNAAVYSGVGTRRIITKDQWKKAGVDNQDTVEWNRTNDFAVELDKLSPEAQEKLRADGSFKLPKAK